MVGMAPPPNVAVEPLPTESSLNKKTKHTHTQWALLFLIYILILRDSGTSARFTWGTRECPSRWRSPWVKHTSSCGCWWPPWRGSRTHRCPERPPAPAENQPQSTASWRSGTETVTGAAYSKHLKSKPSSLPPHLLLVFVCHLHHHLQVTVSTCCACNNMQGRVLFSQLVSQFTNARGGPCGSHLCPGCVAGQRLHRADCPHRSSSPRLHSGSDTETFMRNASIGTVIWDVPSSLSGLICVFRCTFFLVTLGLGLRELHQPPGVQEQGRYQRTDPEPAQWCRSGCGLLGSLQAPPLCGRSWWWGILGSTQSTNLNSNCLSNKNQVTHSIKNSL